tara:strand:+ start:999 stop:1280 length:282 start_codon:yes stop_codon:yes gene_type:complete
MADVNSFRKKTLDGVTTYFYNGREVSKEEFESQRATAKQKQTKMLGGITIEEKRKQMREKVAAAKAAKAAKNKKAKGGIAGRIAKRGYGKARK